MFEAREGVNIFDVEFSKDVKKAMLATSRSRVLNSSYDCPSMLERSIACCMKCPSQALTFEVRVVVVLETTFIFRFNPYRVRGPIQTQSNNH